VRGYHRVQISGILGEAHDGHHDSAGGPTNCLIGDTMVEYLGFGTSCKLAAVQIDLQSTRDREGSG
jgi:hypothetical protein